MAEKEQLVTDLAESVKKEAAAVEEKNQLLKSIEAENQTWYIYTTVLLGLIIVVLSGVTIRQTKRLNA